MINKKVLALLSRILELPENFLWDHVQSHNGSIGEGYFRQMMFHPVSMENRKKSGGVQMHGHQGESLDLASSQYSMLKCSSHRLRGYHDAAKVRVAVLTRRDRLTPIKVSLYQRCKSWGKTGNGDSSSINREA